MEIILKLFPFFVFCFMYVAAKLPCPEYSQCLRSGPAIKFPFRLSNLTVPRMCSYPGFDLISCGPSNETIIHLSSVPFIVRDINYDARQIRINDPDCLPGKILSLTDLPATPFQGDFYQEFTFFSCSSGHRLPELQPITCLSNSTHSVYATSSLPPSGACDVMKKVYVPVPSPSFGAEVPSSSVLFEDIVLHWDSRHSPHCHKCEEVGGQCALMDGPAGLEVDCFHDREGLGSESEYGELRDTDGPECPLCQFGYRTGVTPKTLNPCQHSFHTRCIDGWLRLNDTCPVCRRLGLHTTITI